MRKRANNWLNAMHKQLSSKVWLSITLIILITGLYAFGKTNGIWDIEQYRWYWVPVLIAKTVIETIACIFSLFYVLVAFSYRCPGNVPTTPAKIKKSYSEVFFVYLCCDDIDYEALASVVKSGSGLGSNIWVHDDSLTPETRCRIDQIVGGFAAKYGCHIPILRRESRIGGKPGAINNILRQLPPSAKHLLLCDSDSYLPEGDFLANTLGYFRDPQVALVQFRTIGRVSQDDPDSYKVLSQSIDFYDAFVSLLDRFGWSPFLGHNALLRVSTMKEMGGFTLGQLADDIDYSVRLRIRGYNIKYARETVCGERHPKTYDTLRRRTRKWAYGCTQILMQWSKHVALCRALRYEEKATFFLTVAYYPFQLLLFLYLCVFYFVMPLMGTWVMSLANLFIPSLLILLLTFLPSMLFFLHHGVLHSWPKTVVIWALTYGSQDFIILRGIGRCLLRRNLQWTPTNIVRANQGRLRYAPELVFGALILFAATETDLFSVLLPTTVLFAGKFLIAPEDVKFLVEICSSRCSPF